MTHFIYTHKLTILVVLILCGVGIAVVRFKTHELPIKTVDVVSVLESSTNLETTYETTKAFEDLSKPQKGKPVKIVVNDGLITADLVEVSKDKEGFMETPKSWNAAGWYRLSSELAQEGNIIINGHYDDNLGRPAIFWQLKNVAVGDKLSLVDEFNRPFDYKVSEVYYLSIDDPDRFKIFGYQKGTQTLTLITCGGVWLPSDHTYNKRLIVRALRTN